MSAKSKLRNALDAIEAAEKRLKRSSLDSPGDLNIKRAIRELREAYEEIEHAIRQIEA
jgi:hypothetical protein